MRAERVHPGAAVFLDRDGTLHEELERAPADPRDVRVFRGVPEALARLERAGFVLVIVTNQSAIASGELDHERLARVHEHLREALLPARIAGIFTCPHHPSRGFAPYRRECRCRKPAGGLLLDAARELGLDLARSWVVGDALRDLEAGVAVGARPVLVSTGKGESERARLAPPLSTGVLCVSDLPAAAEAILATPQGR